MKVVGKREPSAKGPREHWRMNSMERKDLLGDGLVLRQHQAVAAGAGNPLADELEVRCDVEVGRIVPGEGLGEVEHEIAIEPGGGMQALDRAIKLVDNRF